MSTPHPCIPPTQLLIEHPQPGVIVLRLNRPQNLNAMTPELVEGLHQALDHIAVDPECRVVILTGSGRGFCAGLDLSGYGSAPHTEHLGTTQRSFAVQKHIASLISHMRAIPQPIIAAVNGPAAGGGLALVLGSDIRIACESAKFNVAFIRVGFSGCDIGTSWLLPRIVGVARSQEMMQDADRENAAIAAGQRVMWNTPFGVALTKEAMWTALEIPAMQSAIDLENRQQILSSHTQDARESMLAFLEKRAPHYTNE